MIKSVDQLLRDLFEGSTEQRINSANALGKSGHKRAVGGLVQALKDPLAELRLAACEALGHLGDSRAVAPLVSLLRDEDESIRGEAFEALISIGESRANALPAGIFSDEDPSAPSAALTQIVWPADLEAVKVLHDALRDSEPEVRIGALYTLGHLGVAGAFEAIEERLRSDPDEDVRTAAGFALGELAERGEPRAVMALRNAWLSRGENVELAVVTCRALGNLGNPTDLPVFEEALGDEDQRVRQLAAMALSQIAGERSNAALVKAMADGHSGVRRIAVHSLSLLADANAIPTLIDAVHGEQPEVRAAIGDALKRFSPQAVQAALSMAGKADRSEQRAAAAYLMGRSGFDCDLATMLADGDIRVRKAAAIALGQLNLPSSYGHLVNALHDDSWMVCVAALEGLRRIGNADCMPMVAQLSHHENHVVRNAMRLTLDVLGESVDKDRT